MLDEGLHRLHRLVQSVEQIGRGLLQPRSGLDQGRDRGLVRFGGHHRIELIDQSIQLRTAGEQFVAPILGRGVHRGQDAHRLVLTTATGCGQYVAQLADRGLEQHGGKFGVLWDLGAGGDGCARPAGVDELHRRHREDVAGHHACGHCVGDGRRVFGFEVDVHEVGVAVGGRDDFVDHPDEHAVILHVGPLGKSVADVHQRGHHRDARVEPPGRLHQQECRNQRSHNEYRGTTAEQLTVGRATPVHLQRVTHLAAEPRS